ncbi:PIN/TRAM domain-containing protein [Haloferula sargassicola]|uniref:TRAM domain-containing protein n=1 Tax=Haloferula sargassicola TaxID=490096 RepID=A0ABP9ULS8_9BACT
MGTPTSVNIVRLLYVLICVVAGFMLAFGTKGNEAWSIPMWAGLLGGLLIAGVFILVEMLMKGFTVRGLSTATFGLLVGLFCAFLLTRVGLSELVNAAFNRVIEMDRGSASGKDIAQTINLAVGTMIYAGFGFIGAVLALRSSRDDFAFILPYVRFRQDGTSGRPVVLDGDTIMDGRIPGLVRAGFLAGRLIVPRFVLDELQSISDSAATTQRQRASRALELLEKMQADSAIAITIEDASEVDKSESLDVRLVQTALLLGARLMTTDESLGKFARLRGVEVLSLHELAEALKPSVVVGERIRLALVRPGKDDHQAVGYLSDGTMIVVNHAVQRIGHTEDVQVISTLQTAGGTMVFAELAG